MRATRGGVLLILRGRREGAPCHFVGAEKFIKQVKHMEEYMQYTLPQNDNNK